jgi:single-strand DNA-binding protein
LQTRKWEDSSGNEKFTTEIVLQNYNSTLTLLDQKNSHDSLASKNEEGTKFNSDDYSSNTLDDEVPF